MTIHPCKSGFLLAVPQLHKTRLNLSDFHYTLGQVMLQEEDTNLLMQFAGIQTATGAPAVGLLSH
jgi:hypothetical protein